MTLIKKIDDEKHFAARRAMRLGRTGARIKPAPKARNAPAFIEDVTPGHSFLGASVTSTPIASDSDSDSDLIPGFTVPRRRQV